MGPRNTLHFRAHFDNLYPRHTLAISLSKWVRRILSLLCVGFMINLFLFLLLWSQSSELLLYLYFGIAVSLLQLIWILLRMYRPSYWGWAKWGDFLNWSFLLAVFYLFAGNFLIQLICIVALSVQFFEAMYYSPQNYDVMNTVIRFKRRKEFKEANQGRKTTNLKGIRIMVSGTVYGIFVFTLFRQISQERLDFLQILEGWIVASAILLILDFLHYGTFYYVRLVSRWRRDRLLVFSGMQTGFNTFWNTWNLGRKKSKNVVLRKTVTSFLNWTILVAVVLIILNAAFDILVPYFILAEDKRESFLSIELNLPAISIVNIALISITCGIVASLLFIIRYRLPSRVIVMPFEQIGDSDPELASLANLITHALVSELQRIGKLLSTRQIENNYSTLSNDAYPVTLTTGSPSELSRQIEQFVSLQLGGNQIQLSFNSFLSRMSRLFAGVMVQGTVQRRDNGSVGIWTGLSRRRMATISAKIALTPRNSTSDIDEVTVNRIARDLALKLFVELGEDQRIASTVDGLEAFLQGIEASGKHQWYRAISYYNKAINFEETGNSRYGLGHYHLGAALTFAGEFEQGLRHFQIAEESGLALPDLHYMLARAILNLYWDGLHEKEVAFQSINRHCNLALIGRPDAPEVYHLLGSAYYRRARLQERDRSASYAIERTTVNTNLAWLTNYRMSAKCLRRALTYYDRNLEGIGNPTANSKLSQKGGIEKLIEARIAATHQLADALRGSQKFEEAEFYYEEFLLIYPRNLRTLVDLSKTYCLAGKWQRCLKFIEHRVLTEEKAMWNADVNFYLGWATLACLSEEIFWSRVRYLRGLKAFLGYRQLEIKDRPAERIRLYVHGLNHLAYAIHQRPRYLARWHQNNWVPQFGFALFRLLRKEKLKDIDFTQVLTEPLGVPFRKQPLTSANMNVPNLADRANTVLQATIWFLLRAESYSFDHLGKPESPSPHFSEYILSLFNAGFVEEFKEAFHSQIANTKNQIQFIWNREEELSQMKEIFHTNKLKLEDALDYLKDRTLNLVETHSPNPLNMLIISKIPLVEQLQSEIMMEKSGVLSRSSLMKIVADWKSIFDKAKDRWKTSEHLFAHYLILGLVHEGAAAQLVSSPAEGENSDTGSASRGNESWEDTANSSFQSLNAHKLFVCYMSLMDLRQKASVQLRRLADNQRQKGFENSWLRLEFGDVAFEFWEDTIRCINQAFRWNDSQIVSEEDLVFQKRLIVDILTSTALLCIRFYAEAGAFERAKDVAHETEAIMDAWRMQWKQSLGQDDRVDFRLDYLTFRYQLSSLKSWHALLLHLGQVDVGVQLRNPWVPLNKSRLFEVISDKLEDAFETMRLHRLGLYAQAQLYMGASHYGEKNIPSQAKPLLGEVLQLLAPFDPFRLVDSWGPRYDVKPRTSKPHLLSNLDIIGKVCGQNQFDTFLDEASLLKDLAEVHFQLGEVDPSIKHLHAAIVVSSHVDVEAEIFLTLVRRLTLLERFDEAQSILEAMRLPTYKLTNKSLSTHKRGEPNVVECVVLTKQQRHAESYVRGRNIARSMHLKPIKGRPDKYDLSLFEKDYKHIEERLHQLVNPNVRGTGKRPIHKKLHSWLKDFEKHWLNPTDWFDNFSDESPEEFAQRFSKRGFYKPMFVPNPFSKKTIKNVGLEQEELMMLHLLPRIFEKDHEAIKEGIYLALMRFAIYHSGKNSQKLVEFIEPNLKVPIHSILHEILYAVDEDTDSKDAQNSQDNISEGRFPKIIPYANVVMRSHILLMLLDESVRMLAQIAELSNTLAYNKTAINDLDALAFEDARYAVLLLRFLKIGQPEIIGQEQRIRINDSLANAFDTLGWVYYRTATTHSNFQRKYFIEKIIQLTPPFLSFDEEFFLGQMDEVNKSSLVFHDDSQPLLYVARYQSEQGLKFGPNKAMNHYHLTRIHMTMLERLWQSVSDKTDENNISMISPYVSMHLRKADLHWALASEFDTVGRLYSNLAWLRHRIDDYGTTWHERQVNSFRGYVRN